MNNSSEWSLQVTWGRRLHPNTGLVPKSPSARHSYGTLSPSNRPQASAGGGEEVSSALANMPHVNKSVGSDEVGASSHQTQNMFSGCNNKYFRLSDWKIFLFARWFLFNNAGAPLLTCLIKPRSFRLFGNIFACWSTSTVLQGLFDSASVDVSVWSRNNSNKQA